MSAPPWAPVAPSAAAKQRRLLRPDHDGRPPITPTLVIVSGPPSSGKTTLTHALAKAIPCPAISRDEIKEGMVHAHGEAFEPSAGDPLTRRTFSVFFEVLRVLLEEDVTVVAEAAFQDPLWRHGLEPLADLANLRIIRCQVEAATAHRRYHDRGERGAHASIIGAEAEDWARTYESFAQLSLAEPSLDVDTTDGYSPSIDEIVEFLSRREQAG